MVVSSGKNTRSEPSAQYLPGIVHAREPPYGQTCVPPTQGTPPPLRTDVRDTHRADMRTTPRVSHLPWSPLRPSHPTCQPPSIPVTWRGRHLTSQLPLRRIHREWQLAVRTGLSTFRTYSSACGSHSVYPLSTTCVIWLTCADSPVCAQSAVNRAKVMSFAH